jgi:glycosyltransferase involved in cell wall biosynthesis
LNAAFQRQVAQLMERGRLTILVPSAKVKRGYDALFRQEVEVMPLRVDLSRRFRQRRPVSDYSRIDFLLSGTPADGRKGQLIAMFAFHHFLRSFHDARPSDYREFSLTFLGLGDDYLSTHTRLIGRSVLGERFHGTGRVGHEQALEIGAACNGVICCSMNEAFPLYVAEGMAMGHVLFRNRVGGVDEQLSPGVNGFSIDSDDIVQFASAIEQALNKTKTTDAELHAMGRASQAMIAPYRHSLYRARLIGD